MYDFNRAVAQPKSTLELTREILAEKAARQQVQSGDLTLKQQQQDMEDTKAAREVLTQTQGDVEKALPILRTRVSPKLFGAIEKSHTEHQNMVLTMDEKKRAAAKDVNDKVLGITNAAAELPDDQFAASRPQLADALTQLLGKPVDPNTLTKDQLKSLQLGSMTFDSYLKGKKEAREVQTFNAEIPVKEAEAQATKDYGVADPKFADAKYRFILQKTKDNRTAEENSFIAAYDKQQLAKKPSLTIGSGAPSLDDQAVDMAARVYLSTGQLPPLGNGAAGATMRSKVLNRASVINQGGDVAANVADFKANSDSLRALQKNFDAVAAFEKTAGKNLDLFVEQARKVVDSGSPLINKPLRSISTAMGGVDMPAYDTARRIAINEIAKVTSSPGLSGVLSDSARHEVESFNPENATLAQTLRVAEVLKQDMGNRHKAYEEQIRDVKGRLRPGGTSQTSGMVTVQIPGHPPGQIPADKLAAFKQKHPDAVEVK